MGLAYYIEDVTNIEEFAYMEILLELQENSKHDALAFIMYLVMLECGFTLKESNSIPTFNCKEVEKQTKSYKMVISRKNNVYNVVLYINKIKCNLDLLIFADSLIANLSAPEHNILKSKNYPCIDVTNHNQIKSVCMDFKDKLVLPVRTLALSDISIYYASLIGMPFDILVYLIKKYLKIQDFISLSKTCKMFYHLLDEQTLWIHFCKREHVKLDESESPKTLFKQFWRSKDTTAFKYHFDHFDIY